MERIIGQIWLSYGPGKGGETATVYSDGEQLYRYASSAFPGRWPSQLTVQLRKGDAVTLGVPCPLGGGAACKEPGAAGLGCTGFHSRSGPAARVLNDDGDLVRLLGVPVRVTPTDGRPYPAYQVEGCDTAPALFLGERGAHEATSLGGQPLEWAVCAETDAHLRLLRRVEGYDYVAPPAA